ncbi:hypothetical protein A3I18_01725 [Candidatus Campbellbacteria bacterium RIFCSPLOWO2_02_FULL_35_11]|uniref:Uncharacterized protein n=2 Tax=Candidatus Campbelliibacteriota TaxID=1752727 RepID=A0A1F5EPH6_9BACT|nr:MAG: hypothetical protein A3E89_00220 [Candidatus Campbellbacteria bacterium RIFCSPHIGHO2_12_FULL_35_10]OGD69677.1 MAG: hypothetical protein A3I18_01725 [Candidatus Campbellbacteria bacterium RIFCSPLOWO2_02_FULL_35_11]
MKKEVSWIVSEYNARLRTMTCPACKKSNVKIINDGKPDESSLYDYLGAHGPQGNLCPASGKYLADVVQGDLRERCLPLG